jgi:hypothetical protein
MGTLGLTATEIGRKINASPEVVNHLLVEKGLLGGGPGAYFVTEAGKAFGVERSITKNNSFDTFEFANWSESVIAELEATAEKIGEMNASLKAAKAAKRLADKIASEEYWAAVAAKQAEKLATVEDPDSGLTAGQKVAIVLGVTAVVAVTVVGGVVVYKVVKRGRERKTERRVADG